MEPDNLNSKKAELPRRSRYYGDLIDSRLLKPGDDYIKLPDLVTIFIMSYDPFGENAMYYEAGTVIRTHPHIPYNDGIRRIFLYADGELSADAGEEEQELKTLLRYIKDSTTENAVDDNTRRLDEIVKSTKANEDVGKRYMKSLQIKSQAEIDEL